jgi:cell division septal protein FtsQ
MIQRRTKLNHRRGGEDAGTGKRRGTFRILTLLIVILSGCSGYWYGRQAQIPDLMKLVAWSDQFFPITSVEVNEVRKVSREEVLAALNLDDARGLIVTDTDKLQQNLESLPWIQRAEVRRVFPDTLVVELKEREPAAVLRDGRRELLLGDDGGVIAEASEGTFEGLPILTGIDSAQVVLKDVDVTQRVLAGIALSSVLGEVGAHRMEVDLRTPGDMVAYYDGLRIRFGEGAFEDKVERYRRLAERGLLRAGEMERPDSPAGRKAQKETSSVDVDSRIRSGVSQHGEVEVDLRFQDRIIVRGKGGKQGWAEKTKSS